MTTETFYVVAIDETANWDAEYLRNLGIRAAFGLYLVRGGEATYCCSLTPSSWSEFLRNEFIWVTGEKRAAAENLGLEYESGGELGGYISYVNPETYNPLFITKSCDVTPDEVDFADAPDEDASEEEREAYRVAIWENAREYEQGNCHDPDILSETNYEKWSADLIGAE